MKKKYKERYAFEKIFNKQKRWQIFFAVVFGAVLIIALRTYECVFFGRAKYIYYAIGILSIIGYFTVPLLVLNKEKE